MPFASANSFGLNSGLSGIELAGVVGGDDVALDGFHRLGGGGALGHDAFEEVAGGPVAVVAADAEEDGSFLLHGLVGFAERAGSG